MVYALGQALYFFFPAYAANMAPIFAAWLGLPGGRPISAAAFGDHKTWRGFIAAYIAATAILYLQYALSLQHLAIAELSILDYAHIPLLLYGGAFGLGAIGGDLVKSFAKRRLGIPSGALWFPFDQLDFVFGALVCLYPLYRLDLRLVAILVIITPALHLLTNYCAYLWGLKKVWW